MTDDTAPKKSALEAAAVFVERRSLVMLALGFASGLPYLLIFDTLSVWLRDSDLSLDVIGFFSLATLAYALKFLWAPLVDRIRLPGLERLLGQRRSWMLLAQIVVMLCLWLLAGGDPARNLGLMALFAVLVGFASATQDIAIDAWRIESSETEKQGAMAAAYQWGYRIAMITAGALPLVLAEFYNWNLSYAVMAALMLIGVAAVLFAPREAQIKARPIPIEGMPVQPAAEAGEWIGRGVLLLTGAIVAGSGLIANAGLLQGPLNFIGLTGAGEAVAAAWDGPAKVYLQLLAVAAGLGIIALAATPIPGAQTRPGVALSGALGQPLMDFFTRYKGSAATILALICFYRLADFVLNINSAFYRDLGFTLIEIAEVRKVFGVVMSVLGVGLGGFAIARLGLIRSLVIGAFAQPISNLAFAWMATQGHEMSALFTAIAIDNVSSSFAGTCLIAYMSSLTSIGFTATQYALFSSLYALPGKLVSSQSGRLVEGMAANAEAGGPIAAFKGLVSGLTPESYAEAMEKSGVAPASLGASYFAFFLYSAVIGVFGIVLAFRVAALTKDLEIDQASAQTTRTTRRSRRRSDAAR